MESLTYTCPSCPVWQDGLPSIRSIETSKGVLRIPFPLTLIMVSVPGGGQPQKSMTKDPAKQTHLIEPFFSPRNRRAFLVWGISHAALYFVVSLSVEALEVVSSSWWFSLSGFLKKNCRESSRMTHFYITVFTRISVVVER